MLCVGFRVQGVGFSCCNFFHSQLSRQALLEPLWLLSLLPVAKEFMTQNLALIFQHLPAPSYLHPMNRERDQMCQVFGLAGARGARKTGTFAPQQRQGQMCRNGGEHRDRPRPQSKTHFLRKGLITQNLAFVSKFACSLLLPTPNEPRVALFRSSRESPETVG